MSFAMNGGNKVWWEESGEGPALLLVMGHAWDSQMWWPAVSVLERQFRVIRFDNRGVGRTEWDERPFGIDDLAADAFAVLDAAGVEQAHAYGISMGGLIVQEMALSRPNRVRSVILGATGALSGAEKTSDFLDAVRARIPMWWVAKVFPSVLYGPHADPRSVAQDVRLMRCAHMPAAGRLAQSRATATYRSSLRIKDITAPTLVLHGDRDKAVPLVKGRELAAGIPGAEFVLLPDAGHNFLADKGDRGTSAVLSFLAQHSREAV